MRHILSTLIVSAASLCFLIPDPAYAQSAADEIIVTGSRISRAQRFNIDITGRNDRSRIFIIE